MIFLLQVQTCYGGHSDMTAKLITLQIPNSIELNTVTNTIQNSPFEKLIVTQLVKKFPTFYWNPKFHYRVLKSPPLGPVLGPNESSLHLSTLLP
jgi:hypothetical protein